MKRTLMSMRGLRKRLQLLCSVACIASLLLACSTPPPPPPQSVPIAPPPPTPQPIIEVPPAPVFTGKVSQAETAKDYRRDAAAHLYEKNARRIYPGKLPPLLYAVGVLQVQIDNHGNVLNVNWMRAPTQAPEVMAEIEQSVRAAAPFPAPLTMGGVIYTDTWLWHKSGRFQLDTLTEGQQ